MRDMLKNNKWKLLFSSLIILLPMLFGLVVFDKLPDTVITHWGGDGVADGSTLKPLAIVLLPLILLGFHWLCLIADALIDKNHEKNQRAHGIVFWILPFLSLFIHGMIYCIALGVRFNYAIVFPLVVGIPLTIIGNYLPKISQNRTMGIKISFTLRNEENWNRTHRFAGKVWVVCGLITVFSVFLPFVAMCVVAGIALGAMILLPLIYSYLVYREHKARGITYPSYAKTAMGKTGIIVTTVMLSAVLVFVSILMFTGNITYKTEEDALVITASYADDLTISYDKIDTVTYRTDLNAGKRIMGFGSPRLSIGTFENEEFSTYTRYCYTRNTNYIVLTQGEHVLVINGKTAEETKAIY